MIGKIEFKLKFQFVRGGAASSNRKGGNVVRILCILLLPLSLNLYSENKAEILTRSFKISL